MRTAMILAGVMTIFLFAIEAAIPASSAVLPLGDSGIVQTAIVYSCAYAIFEVTSVIRG